MGAFHKTYKAEMQIEKKQYTIKYQNDYTSGTQVEVGSHVVSVRIHCTEKWRTSFHIDVFSKSK